MKVLIAGGGVAALEATLALRALAEDRVEVELVAPDTDFTYRPMAVAEPFRLGEMRRFPLERLAELAGARLMPGAVATVDPDGHTLETETGETIAWDVLLLVLGARPREAVPGALTFRGQEDREAFSALLSEASTGRVASLAFAVPGGVAWPLPLYELALMTEIHLADKGVGNVLLELVTPEPAPLALFGEAASAALRELLEVRGIALRTDSTPVAFADGGLRIVPDETVEVDRVVALPTLEGPALTGLPHDRRGFLVTDEFGRVDGRDDVYAAGDVTSFPVKQGGIAAQQADAAADSIAAFAGAPVTPTPFRPVLRGLLLTGLSPRYLRSDLLAGSSAVDSQALWWPPAKIVGRHLAPFLAKNLGLSAEAPERPEGAAVEVEVELDRLQGGAWAAT